MKREDKKLYFFALVLITFVTVYFAVLLSPEVTDNLATTLEGVPKAIENPFSLQFCENTPKVVMVFLLAEFCIACYFYSQMRNVRYGAEHGSARLQDSTRVNRQIADKEYFRNRILTENVRISVIGRAIKLSLNTLVIGGMGSGKSFFTLIPNILQANTSMVITDPSKELVRKTGWFLRYIAGYEVKVFDLENPESSLKYNFFRYIRNEDDILKVVNILFTATTGDKKNAGSQDPMWDNMAKDYLQSLIALLWYRGTEEEQNIETIIWLLDEDKLEEDEDHNRVETPVMALMEDTELRVPGNLATRSYRSATDGEVITIRGVKSTVRGRIGKFLLPSIQSLMSRDELELENLGKRKTALFLAVPSEDTSFNFIISMIYAQVFPMLYQCAREEPDNKLKIPVQFFIDEMPNFVMPKDFVTYLTTSRKHGISYMMYIQELGQLEKIFPEKQFQTVAGTCNTIVYLGGSGQETNKTISGWIGSETISAYSYNRSYGKSGSYSKNEQLLKRELFTPDEVDTKLGDGHALVYVKGQGWIVDQKNNPLGHPNYRYTAGEKEGKTYDWSGSEILQDKMKPLLNAAQGEADIIINLDEIDLEKLKEKLTITL